VNTRAEQDLALIRRLLEDSRSVVVDRGKHFMIWGAVSVVGLLATYGAIVGAVAVAPRWTWTGLVAAGWVASFVVGLRDGRSARVRTLASRLLGGVWLATGVTLTLIAASGLFGGVVPHVALPGVLSAVMGVAVLATSQLTGEGWLAWVAAGWWAGAAVMLFAPGLYTLLVMAVMALALMLVPGAVLYARSRRSDAGPAGELGDPGGAPGDTA
jgi:hypothetical protein